MSECGRSAGADSDLHGVTFLALRRYGLFSGVDD